MGGEAGKPADGQPIPVPPVKGTDVGYDDSAENLRVLCIRCHSEQPNHGHMRSLPQYKAFLEHVAA